MEEGFAMFLCAMAVKCIVIPGLLGLWAHLSPPE
jgi:hypothetical protein